MKRKIDISQIRFKYKKNPLDIKTSNLNPFKQFKKWMNEAIKNKIFEPTAMSLSTINKKNKVSNRIVLLKGIENNSFVFSSQMDSILEKMRNRQLSLLIGQYAQSWYLKAHKKATLTETVKNWQEYQPKYFVLPHPSPRNNIWLKKNPWFEKELVPKLKIKVGKLIS